MPADVLDTALASLTPLLGPVASAPVALEGGITNRNFRVTFGTRDCVLRLCGKDTAVLGIDRLTERLAQEAAHAAGIAPEVLAWLDEPACLVSAFAPGDALSETQIRAPAMVAALGALLAAVHGGPVLPSTFDAFAVPRAHRDDALARGAELPAAYAEAERAAAKIEAALAGQPEHAPKPCHNDLLRANLLRGPGGAPILLDWDYAGMNDPFFDLANLAVNNDFCVADEARLIAAYTGVPSTFRRHAALRLMRVMSDFREAMWGVLQGAVSELDFDYAAYAAEHFGRLLAAVGDPTFEELLHDAKTP